MRVYADSSALIKRAVAEPESDALEDALERHVDNGDAIVTSALTWVEVSRALRSLSGREGPNVDEAIEGALSGVAERPIAEDVVSLARRIGPPVLRTLDAIHLATAILLDVDQVLTYDDRLAAACRQNGLAVTSPGRPERPTGAAPG